MINSITDVQEIGALVIYRKQTTNYPMGDGNFYYTDKRFMVEQGPFSGPYVAVDHWTKFTLPMIMERSLAGNSEQVAVVLPPTNVIHVDFGLNKRIK